MTVFLADCIDSVALLAGAWLAGGSPFVEADKPGTLISDVWGMSPSWGRVSAMMMAALGCSRDGAAVQTASRQCRGCVEEKVVGDNGRG